MLFADLAFALTPALDNLHVFDDLTLGATGTSRAFSVAVDCRSACGVGARIDENIFISDFQPKALTRRQYQPLL